MLCVGVGIAYIMNVVLVVVAAAASAAAAEQQSRRRRRSSCSSSSSSNSSSSSSSSGSGRRRRRAPPPPRRHRGDGGGDGGGHRRSSSRGSNSNTRVLVLVVLVLVVCGVTILWVEGFDHAGSEECIHLSTASPSSSAPRNCPNTNKSRVGRDRSKSGAQEIVNDMSFTLGINQKAGELVAPCTREIKIGTFLEPGIPKDLGGLPGVLGVAPFHVVHYPYI